MNDLGMLLGLSLMFIGVVWLVVGAAGFWRIAAALGLWLFSRRNKIEARHDRRLEEQNERLIRMLEKERADAAGWKMWEEASGWTRRGSTRGKDGRK